MKTEDSITQHATKNELELARVSVRIPPVWRKNIQVWFLQIEAQFSTAGITNENTKFNHVVGSRDIDVAELISDFLTRPATATPFTDLKNRLIQEFEESEGRKNY
jgi:hypothetical protein